MLNQRPKSILKKRRVTFATEEKETPQRSTTDSTPVATPVRGELNPTDLTGALMSVDQVRMKEAITRIEDIFKYAASFRNTLNEGFLEDIEALK